jgi:hypothetical protein
MSHALCLPALLLSTCAALVPLGCSSSQESASTTSPAGTGGASSGSGGGHPGTGGSHPGTGGGKPDAGGINPDAGISNPGSPRTITITNTCTFTLWADALPTTTLPDGGPVELEPGQSFVAGVDNGWSGRVWGRFGCTTGGNGMLTCVDDPFPSTLAEATLTNMPGTGLDFYDISLVDGFDLPMAFYPVGFKPDPMHPYSCGAPTCAKDLRPTCPQPLQDVVGSQTVACANDECKVLGDNMPSSPDCIYPNQYTEFFKTGCPQAYSYPSDDPTSTFTCKGATDYQVTFCP